MRVAASDVSTQDTSTDVAMEVTNYIMKCASSDTEPLAFWQQHSSKLAELYLSMSSASVPVEAMFSTIAGKLNRISSIHDNYAHCLILSRQKTMNMNDF